MKGIIFDIRRFSVHDGPGIRTTIFFKGCPLRCTWCQNPEGLEADIHPIYLKERCIMCGKCAHLSKNGGMEIKEHTLLMHKDKQDKWEEMIDECVSGALRMDAKEISSDQLMEELVKDKVFFNHGGGVTFSGGEPLMQGAFLVEMLKKLKKEGIDTAIETSLECDSDVMKEAILYLDTIYADMKIFDDNKHKMYTGVSNKHIKSNVKILLESEVRDKVIIRTPLIPEFTATEKNLEQIADFLTGIYPKVRYELLNYNPLAEAKYKLLGRKYCYKENPNVYNKDKMLEFGKIVEKQGIRNLIMEI